MEFNEKLQELRKQKGLTQEELASALFVSRTAISKWESGRGYPNLDSLKAIAGFFSITIDDLLSCDEILTIAEEEHKRIGVYNKDLVYGNVPDRDSFGNHNNRSVIISCVSQADVKENTAYFTFCDINYSLQAVAGTFSDNFELAPKDGKITVKINGKLK
jgi:transcriptional regulator with XRE-family HTH domain